MRKTKIVATIGPASREPEQLEKMVIAGMNVVRLNFSHGSFADHQHTVHNIRTIAKKLGQHVGILVDLQGPKIRIGQFVAGAIALSPGQRFCMDPAWPMDQGNDEVVGVGYPELVNDVQPGDFLLLNDGLISVRVESIEGTRIVTRCMVGGELRSSKGINLYGGGLSAGALTDKDRQDLQYACRLQADYLALSFVKSAEDIDQARALVHAMQGQAGIIAKIERKEALDDLDAIIQASDGVMVARGDLALEIGDAQVPLVQKQLIERCREFVKPVIVATQMMESMIVNATPTRAETSDVANATFDGCDAVMLSAETAIGAHPDRVIEAVARTCVTVEQSKWWLKRTEPYSISHLTKNREGVVAWAACANSTAPSSGSHCLFDALRFDDLTLGALSHEFTDLRPVS